MAVSVAVADEESVQEMVKSVSETYGRLDTLINNAAVFSTLTMQPFEEIPLKEWDHVMRVNVTGAFICTQACAPAMLAGGGGAIVNITSISGVRASTLRAAYGTSKAALAHLTKQLAAELGNVGIRVNAVSPGPVDTAMAKQVHTPDIRAGYHDAIPLNRYGLEEELAEAVFFLCSEKASYINGAALNVDGGFAATGIGLPSLRTED